MPLGAMLVISWRSILGVYKLQERNISCLDLMSNSIRLYPRRRSSRAETA